MRERVKEVLPAAAGLILFLVALEVLRHELHALSWPALVDDILATPPRQLIAAVILTLLNYAIVTGYDFIALAYVGKRVAPLRIAAASFVAYAIASNVGFGMLPGAWVRYRFYSRWGVTAEELSRIVFAYSVTFWLGLLLLGGVSLALSPLPAALEWPARAMVAPIGWSLAIVAVGYVGLTVIRRHPIRLRRLELPLPPPRLAAAQLGVSVLDWAVAGAVFYVLLPSSEAQFTTVLAAFLAAQLLGVVSHVPGGVGIFEGLMVLLLKPYLSSAGLLPALVVYRAVFYLFPLAGALVGLLADEIRQRRSQTARAGAVLGRLSEALTPRVLAIFTFIGGLVLLFSGATPAADGRLGLLYRLVPLGIIETSHFLGSLAGAALLLLSQGLARRLDAAFYLTAIGLGLGIAASLLKGADYEEAVILSFTLVALLRARPAFDRRAALLETRFSAGWIAAVAAALVASVWLGFFAFKHVEYSAELWWQFELRNEASRFLRASVGAAALTLFFAIARLLGHAPHQADGPSDQDMADAATVVSGQSATYANLVYLRDKALLFDETRSGFVMYGVQGRTWVAMGDPVCAADQIVPLIRLFLERCDDFGGTPVFYEVRKERLHHYADFGLTFVKLGEEARVDLRDFSIAGPKGARYRQSMKRLEKDGGHFRVLTTGEVPTVMNDLRRVSDSWLRSRSAGEKGFSLGYFDPHYLARFPVAVIERGGEIQAFANLWQGAQLEELSMDLMRYQSDAPKGVMEALICHLLVWSRQAGYHYFVLGMAPMSGFERSPVAPLWSRLGTLLYEHGDALYKFQGLRAFKEKFNPAWEPHYLAYPGGLKLPRILADVSALVAGGYRRNFLSESVDDVPSAIPGSWLVLLLPERPAVELLPRLRSPRPARPPTRSMFQGPGTATC